MRGEGGGKKTGNDYDSMQRNTKLQLIGGRK